MRTLWERVTDVIKHEIRKHGHSRGHVTVEDRVNSFTQHELLECISDALEDMFPGPSPEVSVSVPTMQDAIDAGNGTLHGAIDFWQAEADKYKQQRDDLQDKYDRLLSALQGLMETEPGYSQERCAAIASAELEITKAQAGGSNE
jgi:hypothetical protein